jgi:hypothetical protein
LVELKGSQRVNDDKSSIEHEVLEEVMEQDEPDEDEEPEGTDITETTEVDEEKEEEETQVELEDELSGQSVSKGAGESDNGETEEEDVQEDGGEGRFGERGGEGDRERAKEEEGNFVSKVVSGWN